MSDGMPTTTVRWGQFHYENEIHAASSADYAVSVHTWGGGLRIRADQVHDDGLYMTGVQARKLALAILQTVDESERNLKDD
jgi:hypothetical protein